MPVTVRSAHGASVGAENRRNFLHSKGYDMGKLDIGSFIELASSQVWGFAFPDYARHSMPAGRYTLVRFEDSYGPIFRHDEHGSEWAASLSDIVAVTEAVEGGRSYRPLTRELANWRNHQ